MFAGWEGQWEDIVEMEVRSGEINRGCVVRGTRKGSARGCSCRPELPSSESNPRWADSHQAMHVHGTNVIC
jgi:hypothetical protein